ncbi:hypothetical protein [Actinomadura harenae]|uniref:Uncharacterized protein n=1 Tax=Actinomadura harenae TaxID=2483351 RepID=A0A3M2M3C9_9ACTN|nr:hypothetical protein [Actinomadura harenae]RMI43313.1 hypothetical protein EBO15_16670 [Actinomadura harenae]
MTRGNRPRPNPDHSARWLPGRQITPPPGALAALLICGVVLAALGWVLLAAPFGPDIRAQEPLHTAVRMWALTAGSLWTLAMVGVVSRAVVTTPRNMRAAQEQAEQDPPGAPLPGEPSAGEQRRQPAGFARDLALRATALAAAALPMALCGWLLPSVILNPRHPAPHFAAPMLTLTFALAAFTHATLSVAVLLPAVRPRRDADADPAERTMVAPSKREES